MKVVSPLFFREIPYRLKGINVYAVAKKLSFTRSLAHLLKNFFNVGESFEKKSFRAAALCL